MRLTAPLIASGGDALARKGKRDSRNSALGTAGDLTYGGLASGHLRSARAVRVLGRDCRKEHKGWRNAAGCYAVVRQAPEAKTAKLASFARPQLI